jgi:hypothetical protein
MVVMAREAWTDHRLDDLNKKVDEGFKDMREEFRSLRSETQAEFHAVREEIAGISRDLRHLTYGLIGTMLVGFLGTIATIITQT